MKRWILSFILILFTFPVFSIKSKEMNQDTPKFPQGKGAILMEDLKEGKVYGSLEKMAGKQKAKSIRLIGHATFDTPKDGMLAGNKFVLIGWLGVQKSEDPSKIVMFKEPIVSSFIIKNGLDAKGVSLPTFGDRRHLETAIQDLEANKIDLEDLKKQRVIKMPSGKGTEFILPVEKGQEKHKLAVDSALNSEVIEQTLNAEFKNGPQISSDFHGQDKGTLNSKLGSTDPHNVLSGFSSSGLENSQREKTRDNTEKEQKNSVDFGPEITVELTEEGCPPEHDPLQETVTITSKAKKFENGRLLEEGNCERTLEIYQVKKNYLCEECQDEIDFASKKAYPRYQEYWIDREHQWHKLGVKIDLGNPLTIAEHSGECGFDTVNESGFALKMFKLGYLNKFGVFKVVEECRATEGSEKFPIQETTKGCELIHDFANKVSYEQKRSIFKANRIEHEVQQCHPIEDALPHEFVKMGCPEILSLEGKMLTPTVRRQITLSTKLKKLITDDCEPSDPMPLQVTRQDCEDKYFHDFPSGKSYLKKRYFIVKDHDLIHYVTGCVRTDDFIPQQTECHGWEHDDQNKISRPRLSIYIETGQGRLDLDPPKVRGELGQMVYILVKNEDRPTRNFYFEGCYRRTHSQSINVYRRGDGSIYEQILGPGNIIMSNVNECTSRIEKTGEQLTRKGFRLDKRSRKTWVWSERTLTTNPQGTIVQTTPWIERTREINPKPEKEYDYEPSRSEKDWF